MTTYTNEGIKHADQSKKKRILCVSVGIVSIRTVFFWRIRQFILI